MQGLRSSTVVTNELAQAIGAFGAQLHATHSNRDNPECVITVEGEPGNWRRLCATTSTGCD